MPCVIFKWLLQCNIYTAILITIIFFIIVFVIIVYFFKNKVMFMPSSTLLDINDGKWLKFGNSSVNSSSSLSGYIYQTGSKDIVIFSHGNGGNLTWYTPITDRLRNRIDVFTYDYPGYGLSEGIPTEESVLGSGLEAYDLVKSLGYKRIYCYGFSLGGAVTTHIAKHRKVDGMVLQSTFAKISDCVPIVGKIVVGTQFNSVYNVDSLECPVLIAHSKDDSVVPYESAKALYDAINSVKYFYDIQGGHNSPPIHSEYYDRIFNQVFLY